MVEDDRLNLILLDLSVLNGVRDTECSVGNVCDFQYVQLCSFASCEFCHVVRASAG